MIHLYIHKKKKVRRKELQEKEVVRNEKQRSAS